MINWYDLIINLFNASLMVYTFYLFFDYFADKKLNKWVHYLLLVFIGLILTGIVSFVPIGIPRTILLFLIPLMVSLLFRLKWYNHILLSILVHAMGGISEFIVTVLISIVFSVDTQTATQGIFQILGIILSKMILFFVLVIMRLLKYKLSYSLTPKKAITLLMIPTSTTVISLIHINLFVKFPVESQLIIYSSLISYIILVLSNIIVFHLIDHSYKESEKEKQLSTVTELLQAQAKQYEQMQEHNNTVMKLRHDQKNFIIGLISELESGEIATAKNALKNQLDLLKKPDEFEFNNIVSAVLKTKSEYASKVDVQIDFQYSELHKIQASAVDIAIILGNALDNAIEATQATGKENRIIHTIVKVNHDLIVIIIKNPVAKDVDVTNLISTKRNDGSKGFGIASIKELVKKHDGEVIFKCQNMIFETNIVMRNGRD